MSNQVETVMPTEGRNRVVIEDVRPRVDDGRFPYKRVAGEIVDVSAVIYGDGHDHVAARILYRHDGEANWRLAKMSPTVNDVWRGSFETDLVGLWQFRIEAWIDHFDTWADDLGKRIAAYRSVPEPVTERPASFDPSQASSEIQLALRTGAEILYRTSTELAGKGAEELQSIAHTFRQMANQNLSYDRNPVTLEMREVASKYPDLRFATQSIDYYVRVDRTKARFSTWYEFFPRSAGDQGKHGTLADAAKLVPGLADAGFDVIYLPPINPIGTAFRKGKNNSVAAAPDDIGSPWAIGSSDGGHTAIAPELGGFVDFDALMATLALHKVEIALDIAFQCSPDHPWVKSHPDWFSIRPDGSIQYAENPPKKYQDIYPLNFESDDWRNLWEELSNVFVFWIKRGVKIFRVDNPHTKALPFWEWCIAKIQRTHPDVIFLAEAFTRPHLMYGLAKRGYTQSYTYFTWRTTKEELTTYLKELISEPVSHFFRPNFWPNTPDILPPMFNTGGRPAFMQRVILASTLAANYGIYGPAYELMEGRPLRIGGEEYLDSEKYQLREWDRSRKDSLMPLLATLNKARHQHAALQQNDTLHFHDTDNPMIICYSKRVGDDVVLVLVNLDTEYVQSGWTLLDMPSLGISQNAEFTCTDLLTESTYVWSGPRNYVSLDPAALPAHLFHIAASTASDQ